MPARRLSQPPIGNPWRSERQQNGGREQDACGEVGKPPRRCAGQRVRLRGECQGQRPGAPRARHRSRADDQIACKTRGAFSHAWAVPPYLATSALTPCSRVSALRPPSSAALRYQTAACAGSGLRPITPDWERKLGSKVLASAVAAPALPAFAAYW